MLDSCQKECEECGCGKISFYGVFCLFIPMAYMTKAHGWFSRSLEWHITASANYKKMGEGEGEMREGKRESKYETFLFSSIICFFELKGKAGDLKLFICTEQSSICKIRKGRK